MNGNQRFICLKLDKLIFILVFIIRSITVRRGRTIKFEFLHFNIPRSVDSECRSYVILKNGLNMESPFLGQGKFCGTTIPTVDKTSSNRALVGKEISFHIFKLYVRT